MHLSAQRLQLRGEDFNGHAPAQTPTGIRRIAGVDACPHAGVDELGAHRIAIGEGAELAGGVV
jgi:hypothetical protein